MDCEEDSESLLVQEDMEDSEQHDQHRDQAIVHEDSSNQSASTKQEEGLEDNDDDEDEKKTKTKAPAPKKRGGNRRKRRGKAKGASSAKKANLDDKIDESEIEVTANTSSEKIDDPAAVSEDQQDDENKNNEDEEEEPDRDPPSPVMTRRSNRKLQQQQQQQQQSIQKTESKDTDEEGEPMEEDDDGNLRPDTACGGTDPDQETLDLDSKYDDAESVVSELDSVASSSTLTTRPTKNRDGGGQGGPSSKKKPSNKNSAASGKSKNNTSNGNAASTKGKSRRIIFKKSATRAPTAVARAVTSDRVYYRGQYFTRGDIVSVEDMDGSVYYAQLRGFLTDQYCEKSGVITWLLPTTNSPPPEESFDPSTYVIGPEEDLPRKLDYFTFVMHSPDDYFYYKKAPYPTMAIQTDQEYLMTRNGPKVRVIKAGQSVYCSSVPPLIPMPTASSVGGSS